MKRPTAHGGTEPDLHTRRHTLLVGCGWTLALALSVSMPAAVADAGEGEVPAQSPIRKVLFLGNSITLHGPAPAIGWSGNWGMAASAQDKDYVHLVLSALAKRTSTAGQSMIKNIAEFERGYADYDVQQKLQDARQFQPDLIIVAIGENVAALQTEAEQTRFQNSLTLLLKQLTRDHHPRVIVRSCFWPNKAKDRILKDACDAVGGTYVDISSLSKSEANYARSERQYDHQGVAAHPGDAGMQAIATAILQAIDHVPASGEAPAAQARRQS